MPWNLRRTRRFFITPPTGPAIAQTPGVPDSTPQGGTPPAPCASLSLTPSSETIAVGGTQQLTVVARDANNNVLTGRTATFVSSAPSIARVDATGLVTGVAVGTATITAACEGVSVTQTSTVAAIGSYVDGMTDLLRITPRERLVAATANVPGAAVGTLVIRTHVGSVVRGHVYKRTTNAPDAAIDYTSVVTATAPNGGVTVTTDRIADEPHQFATSTFRAVGIMAGIFPVDVTCNGVTQRVFVWVTPRHLTLSEAAGLTPVPTGAGVILPQYLPDFEPVRGPSQANGGTVVSITTRAQLNGAAYAPQYGTQYLIADGLYDDGGNGALTFNPPTGTAPGWCDFVGANHYTRIGTDTVNLTRAITAAEDAAQPTIQNGYLENNPAVDVTQRCAGLRFIGVAGQIGPNLRNGIVQTGTMVFCLGPRYGAVNTPADLAQHCGIFQCGVRGNAPIPVAIATAVTTAAPTITTGQTVLQFAPGTVLPAMTVGNAVRIRRVGYSYTGQEEAFIYKAGLTKSTPDMDAGIFAFASYNQTTGALTLSTQASTAGWSGNGGESVTLYSVPADGQQRRACQSGINVVANDYVVSGCRVTNIGRQREQDTQGIGSQNGQRGTIRMNTIGAAAEGILLGGGSTYGAGTSDAVNFTPAHVSIVGNLIDRQGQLANWYGGWYVYKNGAEMKTGHYVLWEGNVWMFLPHLGQNQQAGAPLVIKTAYTSSGNDVAFGTQHVTGRYNRVHRGHTMTTILSPGVLYVAWYGNLYTACVPSQSDNRPPFLSCGSTAENYDTTSPAYVYVDHNTHVPPTVADWGAAIFDDYAKGGLAGPFYVRSNITRGRASSSYNAGGPMFYAVQRGLGFSSDQPGIVNSYFASGGYVSASNALFDMAAIAGGTAFPFAADRLLTAPAQRSGGVGDFAGDPFDQSYTSAPTSLGIAAGSVLLGAGHDGQDIGAPIGTVQAYTAVAAGTV